MAQILDLGKIRFQFKASGMSLLNISSMMLFLLKAILMST